MAEVTWINGTINPPEKGEYYVCQEAQRDFGGGFNKGTIEIHTDYFNGEVWNEIGHDDSYWKVLCWANILRPNIPAYLRDRVKIYFGKKVIDE